MAQPKSGLTSRDAWANYKAAHADWHAAKLRGANYVELNAIGERVKTTWDVYSRSFCKEHSEQIALLVFGKPRRPA